MELPNEHNVKDAYIMYPYIYIYTQHTCIHMYAQTHTFATHVFTLHMSLHTNTYNEIFLFLHINF